MSTLNAGILNFAAKLPEGTPIAAKSLLHLGNRAAVDQALSRLARSGKLIRAGRGTITLDYQVHAYDNSVRKAWLDTHRGFFNGSSLFYCPQGREQSAFEITVAKPDAALCPGWKLATAMSEVAIDESGFGTYLAASYEELIDHPVEMADFQRIEFDVDGVPHSLILSGRCEPDATRLAADLRRVCHVQRELFGQEPRLRQYLFLTQVTANGYGGLEHRASTALVCARDALPKPGAYYDALKPLCSRLEIWHTVYNHVLDDAAAIVEWVKGSGLRPFLDPLEPPQRKAFLADYTARIAASHLPQADGKVLLRFPRLFIVATR